MSEILNNSNDEIDTTSETIVQVEHTSAKDSDENTIDKKLPENNFLALAQRYSGKLIDRYKEFVNNFSVSQREKRIAESIQDKMSDFESEIISKELKEFEGVVLQSLRFDFEQMVQSYVNKKYGNTSEEIISTFKKLQINFIQESEEYFREVSQKISKYTEMSLSDSYKHPAQKRIIENMITHLEKNLSEFMKLQNKTLENISSLSELEFSKKEGSYENS